MLSEMNPALIRHLLQFRHAQFRRQLADGVASFHGTLEKVRQGSPHLRRRSGLGGGQFKEVPQVGHFFLADQTVRLVAGSAVKETDDGPAA